ncbi:MAG: hypothetical protein KDD61_08550 [Bdellovibrionales bacterium]|nr:hypothetical protein [Bdellovibrionales bacterium]
MKSIEYKINFKTLSCLLTLIGLTFVPGPSMADNHKSFRHSTEAHHSCNCETSQNITAGQMSDLMNVLDNLHSQSKISCSSQDYDCVLDAIFAVMKMTPTGKMVAEKIKRFQKVGVGGQPPLLKVRVMEKTNKNGPDGRYDGHSSLNLTAVPVGGFEKEDDLLKDPDFIRVVTYMIHEGVHAIAHDFAKKGKFPSFDPGTKDNEALAYFYQAKFIRELGGVGVEFKEPKKPIYWDLSSLRRIKALRTMGIQKETPTHEAKDIFAEAEFDVIDDAEAASDVRRLARYYDFVQHSKDRSDLWDMTEDTVPQASKTRMVTDLIFDDVSSDYNMKQSYGYLTNRMFFYWDMPESKSGYTTKDYFKHFQSALSESDFHSLADSNPNYPTVDPQGGH